MGVEFASAVGSNDPSGSNTQRRQMLRQAMARERLDALVCRLPENVLLLSGYWPICGWVYVVFPLEGQVMCIAPESEEQEARADMNDTVIIAYPFGTKELVDQRAEVRRGLDSARAGSAWRRVGFEGSFETAAPAWNAAEAYLPADPSRKLLEEAFGADNLVDATSLLEAERAVKTPFEVEKVRRASRTWGSGLTKIGRMEPDMTCHSIEESFSGYFDTHHGACLGVLTPRWMRLVAPKRPEIFARFARNVMGIVEPGRPCRGAARRGGV